MTSSELQILNAELSRVVIVGSGNVAEALARAVGQSG